MLAQPVSMCTIHSVDARAVVLACRSRERGAKLLTELQAEAARVGHTDAKIEARVLSHGDLALTQAIPDAFATRANLVICVQSLPCEGLGCRACRSGHAPGNCANQSGQSPASCRSSRMCVAGHEPRPGVTALSARICRQLAASQGAAACPRQQRRHLQHGRCVQGRRDSPACRPAPGAGGDCCSSAH